MPASTPASRPRLALAAEATAAVMRIGGQLASGAHQRLAHAPAHADDDNPCRRHGSNSQAPEKKRLTPSRNPFSRGA